MSLFPYLFDNDAWQRTDIERLKAGATALYRTVRRHQVASRDHLDQLESKVCELALVCRSLLELMLEKGVIQKEDLSQVMAKIDAEDGVLDGRVTPERHRPGAKATKTIKLVGLAEKNLQRKQALGRARAKETPPESPPESPAEGVTG